jgi:ElaA protein
VHAEPRCDWQLVHFDDLQPRDLYDALALRNAVFVVEQNCAYQDCDGVDRVSHHLWTRGSDGVMAAYLRVIPPSVCYEEASIGRIITARGARRRGFGRAVLREGIMRVEELYGPVAIRIGAQRYLLRFYEEFGFASTGREYDEDGIPHTEMLRRRG